MLDRRRFLALSGVLAFELFGRSPRAARAGAKGILRPFQLHLFRDHKLVDVLGYRRCILGQLFVVESLEAPVAAAKPVAKTLELPYLGNQECISAIPEGRYDGSVLEDGDLGWRIAIQGVPGRRFIRIHTGNVSAEIEGCILLGKSIHKDRDCGCQAPRDTDEKGCIKKDSKFEVAKACQGKVLPIVDSRTARNDLRALYGSGTSRRVAIRVSS